MDKRYHKLLFLVLLLLLIFSGFIRDFFMININHVLKHLQQDIANYAYPSFSFLEEWRIKDIMALKWGLTILFFFYFWLISYGVLKTYFSTTNTSVVAISYTYIGIIGIAGFLYILGWILGIDKSMYHIVRTLIGISHSFMPAMIVFLYLKYFPK